MNKLHLLTLCTLLLRSATTRGAESAIPKEALQVLRITTAATTTHVAKLLEEFSGRELGSVLVSPAEQYPSRKSDITDLQRGLRLLIDQVSALGLAQQAATKK